MADHLDAPGLTSPAMDTRIDITDHYLFRKPGDQHRTVLVFNVNPLAPTHADEFRSGAVYETLIDTNGDAIPNLAFRYRFTPKTGSKQFAHVTRAELPAQVQDGHLFGKEKLLVDHAPVSFGSRAVITSGHEGVRFFAGFRSDPFFFDLTGFMNNFKFTGTDFFAGKNVFSIVLEVPNKLLGASKQAGGASKKRGGTSDKIGVWVRTLAPMTMQPDHVTQADQMGRPAINTVFNHGNDKNAFNVTQPADQRSALTASGKSFLQVFASELEALGGYSAAQAQATAEVLLPDVLTFDYSKPDGYLNGRRLQDDVIDISLKLVTNGKITGDGVGPHTDYSARFPYLGKPNA